MPIYDHWSGRAEVKDGLSPEELAQVDRDLTAMAERDMGRNSGLGQLDQLALDMTKPVQQARPVSVAAAAAMSPQQLEAIQSRRQQGVQFDQQLAAREREGERRFEQMTDLDRLRSAERGRRDQRVAETQGRQFEQQQIAGEKRFQAELAADETRFKREQAAKQAAVQSGLEVGREFSLDGGRYRSFIHPETGQYEVETLIEPKPPDVTAKEPNTEWVEDRGGMQYQITREEFAAKPPGTYFKLGSGPASRKDSGSGGGAGGDVTEQQTLDANFRKSLVAARQGQINAIKSRAAAADEELTQDERDLISGYEADNIADSKAIASISQTPFGHAATTANKRIRVGRDASGRLVR